MAKAQLSVRAPVVITGAGGQLGGYVLRHALLEHRNVLPILRPAPGRHVEGIALDLTDRTAVLNFLDTARPGGILHLAAMSSVADCYQRPELARRTNVEATAWLAEWAACHAARLVHVSTDMVFDGENAPYREGDLPCPLSVYGRTKADAEKTVLLYPQHVVARLSWLAGPRLGGPPRFFDDMVATLRRRAPVALFTDEWRTPLALPDAASALLALLDHDFSGLVHLGGPERLSRWDMGLQIAAHLGVDADLVVPTSRKQAAAAEPRPKDLALSSSLWRGLMPNSPWTPFPQMLRDGIPV